MTVFILPHPETAECPSHPGELFTPEQECFRCGTERMVAEFTVRLKRAACGASEGAS